MSKIVNVIKGDITKIEFDAIVKAANSSLAQIFPIVYDQMLMQEYKIKLSL